MTIDVADPKQTYSIAGTGPYAVPWPYAAGALRVYAQVSGAWQPLGATDWSVDPALSTVSGSVHLTAAAAAAHAGAALLIVRETPIEQGWQGVLGEREAGLEAQLDQLVAALQELRAGMAGAARIIGVAPPVEIPAGHAVMRTESGFGPGPIVAEIAEAADNAASAALSATGAAASLAAVLAAQIALTAWIRGAWQAGAPYAVSDIVEVSGSSWICLTAHTSAAVFTTDQAVGRWQLLAERGATGAGTGDMLKAANLSDLANADVALSNLGAAAAGKAVLRAASAGAQRAAMGAAPIDTPTFLNAAYAPTPAAGDVGTRLATTAFVAASFAPVPKSAAGLGQSYSVYVGGSTAALVPAGGRWRVVVIRRSRTTWLIDDFYSGVWAGGTNLFVTGPAQDAWLDCWRIA